MTPRPSAKPEHVCKPSCHNPCLLDDEKPRRSGAAPTKPPTEQELAALRKYKNRIDIAFTAGMLGLSGEVGFKIPCHQFVTSMKVAFRQAEDEYMKEVGADKLRAAAPSAKYPCPECSFFADTIAAIVQHAAAHGIPSAEGTPKPHRKWKTIRNKSEAEEILAARAGAGTDADTPQLSEEFVNTCGLTIDGNFYTFRRIQEIVREAEREAGPKVK